MILKNFNDGMIIYLNVNALSTGSEEEGKGMRMNRKMGIAEGKRKQEADAIMKVYKERKVIV